MIFCFIFKCKSEWLNVCDFWYLCDKFLLSEYLMYKIFVWEIEWLDMNLLNYVGVERVCEDYKGIR